MKQLLPILVIFFVAACATSPRAPAPRDGELPQGDQGGAQKVGKPYKIAGRWYYPKEEPYYDEIGLASWYGRKFHGKQTANGETYNMNALTAAHKTLPMPSFVKVTNLSNGRSITLRVNDRGPFVDDRVIDVSRRGAQLLGFQKQGVTKVRVQASDENGNILIDPNPTRRFANDERASHYIQVGSFSRRSSANEQARRLRKEGEKPIVQEALVNGRTLWRVRVGPFLNRINAQEILDRLVGQGFYEARIFSESNE